MTILTCPACGASGISVDVHGSLECLYCGVRLAGDPFVCPACDQVNLPKAEVCAQCGEPLTLAAQVMSRRGGQGSPLFLTRARAQAVDLKSTGERASQVRMDSLRQVDRVREEALRRASAERNAEDRRLVRFLLIGLALLLALLGLIGLLTQIL